MPSHQRLPVTEKPIQVFIPRLVADTVSFQFHENAVQTLHRPTSDIFITKERRVAPTYPSYDDS